VDAVCLVLAGVIFASLPTDEFTLAWRHSVEKTRWEERYRVDGDRLILVEARIEGMGAGMEPPEGAILRDGWWTWMPGLRIEALGLMQSAYAGEWTFCWDGNCRALGDLLAPAAPNGAVDLRACDASRRRGEAQKR
jgi:hypothetical protein